MHKADGQTEPTISETGAFQTSKTLLEREAALRKKLDFVPFLLEAPLAFSIIEMRIPAMLSGAIYRNDEPREVV